MMELDGKQMKKNMAKGIKMPKNQKPGYEIPAVKFGVMIQNSQEVRAEKKNRTKRRRDISV